jgi:hypothetical protein
MALLQHACARDRHCLTDTTLLLVLPRENFEKLVKSTPHLRSNLDLAVRSRLLARKVQFKWLAPDEVIYFLARKHIVVLYKNLILPVLALLSQAACSMHGWRLRRSRSSCLLVFSSLTAVILWVIWLAIDWGTIITSSQTAAWCGLKGSLAYMTAGRNHR